MMRDQPADSIWTVSGLNRYIRTALETDYRLKDLIVVGEISNLSRPASGHLYFTLKDQSAAIRCVMWKAQAARLIYRPREGDRVQAHGAVGVYEAGGQYQLYADWLQAEGGGDLFREFNALKARLEAEGLFDPSRKRPLPAVPARIAIVTSPSGAALRDMLNVIRRRWPALEVILCPTPVQGDDAPYGIVQALAAANSLRPDLIIIARGGGSMEDLWAFNDEGVVRAIAASGLPVVSGVGHETDFTLADFAADLRAPTPSAAAELATPDRAQFLAEVQARVERLTAAMQLRIRERRWALSGRLSALRGLSPRAILVNSRQRLDDLTERAAATARHTLELRRHRLDGLHLRLAALSPLSILNRGYAIVTRAGTTEVIRSANAVHSGDELEVRVSEGQFGVEVTPPRRHEDTKGHEGKQSG
jgi:exodeoxyribonuclease VII large subunit